MDFNGYPLALMQSSLSLCSFENSHPMTFYPCLNALMNHVLPHVLRDSNCMCISTDVTTFPVLYLAAPTTRSTRNMRNVHIFTSSIYKQSERTLSCLKTRAECEVCK